MTQLNFALKLEDFSITLLNRLLSIEGQLAAGQLAANILAACQSSASQAPPQAPKILQHNFNKSDSQP